MAWFFFTCTKIRLNAAHVSIRVLNCSFFALSLSDSTERKWWEPCKLLCACSNNTGLFPKIHKSLSTAYSSFFTSTCLSSAQYASHCQSQGRASVSLSRTGSPLFPRPLLHPWLLVILITTVRGRGKSHSTADGEKERREAHKQQQNTHDGPLLSTGLCVCTCLCVGMTSQACQADGVPKVGQEERCSICCLARVNIMAHWPTSCRHCALSHRDAKTRSTRRSSRFAVRVICSDSRWSVLIFEPSVY